MKEKILLIILIVIISIASCMKERANYSEPGDDKQQRGLNSAICGQPCA